MRGVVISLPRRQKEKLPGMWRGLAELEEWEVFDAFDGSRMSVRPGVPVPGVGPQYVNYLLANPSKIGHLGCSMSHSAVVKMLARDSGPPDQLWVVLEDDAVMPDGWVSEARRRARLLTDRVDPEWDMLLLGYSCMYRDDCRRCALNDGLRYHRAEGLAKVAHFQGTWAYVLNGRRAAQRLASMLYPQDWLIDTHYSTLAQKRGLRLWGCVPWVVYHPGHFGVSSLGYESRAPEEQYRSDTNAAAQ